LTLFGSTPLHRPGNDSPTAFLFARRLTSLAFLAYYSLTLP